MSKLEQLTPNAAVRGILPDGLVTVVSVQWFGSEALELTYKSANGKVANELLYRHDEARIEGRNRGTNSIALVSVFPNAATASSPRRYSSQRSLTGHLNRSIDGVFEIVRVVGRGLVSIAEMHAIVTGAHHPQSEPEMARD
jgi:hypothetical protein